MLKHEIAVAVPSVWMRIKELRCNDTALLAPKFAESLEEMMIYANENIKRVRISSQSLIPFDPIIFETWRANELQAIYFSQGTTKARTALYGWHFYGLAVDIISKSMEWSVPNKWWEQLAKLAESRGLRSGRRWKKKVAGSYVSNPDNPHIYPGNLKSSPSNEARRLYFGTTNWHGLAPYTGDAHLEGLLRVWKAVRAI